MRISSLRARLQLLVWVAIIPVFLLIVLGGIAYRRHEEARIRDEVASLANLAKAGLERSVDSTRQLLLTISHADVIREGSPADISAFFRDLHQNFPEHTNFGAVDLQGNVFASAVPLTEPVSASDMFWFRETLKSRAFTIGEYQVGRHTGLEVLVFGQPVFDPSGALRFVLFTAMERRWLNRLWPGLKLPPDSHFIITDRRGTVLFHYPDNERSAGQSKSPLPLVQAMLSRTEGRAEAECEDGVTRIYAVAGVAAGNALHLGVGISKKAALQEANTVLAIGLASLTLVTLAGLFLARVFSRRLRQNGGDDREGHARPALVPRSHRRVE